MHGHIRRPPPVAPTPAMAVPIALSRLFHMGVHVHPYLFSPLLRCPSLSMCPHHCSSIVRPRAWPQQPASRQLRTRAVSESSSDQQEAPRNPSKLSKPKGSKSKQRLDAACQALHPHLSRNLIQSWILQGKVRVDDKVVSKAGAQVGPDAKIVLMAEEPKYVCRAGHKLEAALQHFKVDVTGMVCLDSGQSTGGFTDCLLQHGATHVFGIDVGYGQVADKVRNDPRVTVMERFNLRHLKPEELPMQVDLATLDLAFISVLKVVPAVIRVLKPPPAGQLLVLIKPQFEAGRAQVSSGGVVRDPKVHKEVVARVTEGICALGFVCQGVIESPLKGDKSGNTEFLAHFTRDLSRSSDPALQQLVEAAAAAQRKEEEAEEDAPGGGPV